MLFPIPQDIKRLETSRSQIVAEKEMKGFEEVYPQNNFSIYNCLMRDSTQAQAVALKVYYQKRLNESGVRIGLSYEDCLRKTDPSLVARFLEKTNAVELKKISNNTLQKAGWNHIAADSIYNKVTYWWNNK